MKKKLAVFTLYTEMGASSQYRIYLYKDVIKEKFDVKWYSFWNDKYVTKYMNNKNKYRILILLQYIVSSIKRWYQLNFLATKCDVIFIQKGIIPKSKKIFLKRLKKNGVKVVFDVDDAIYTSKKDCSTDIAKNAEVVICGNDTLKGYYSKYNDNCVVLPTIENTYNYKKYWSDTFEKKSIVWIGSKATIKNLDIIVEAFNKFIEKHLEVNFYIISNSDFGYTKKIKNAHFVKWSKEGYIEDLSKATVGIMPLEDNEYNRGKCGFKLIQYMNMKKPVIGSGVGVNSNIIEKNGVIANSTKEWIDGLERLLYDKKFYEECSWHIEKDLKTKYGFKYISNELIQLLD